MTSVDIYQYLRSEKLAPIFFEREQHSEFSSLNWSPDVKLGKIQSPLEILKISGRTLIQAKILTYPSDGQSPEVERTINLRGLKTKFSRLKIWLSITFKFQNLSSSLFFILTFPKFENQNKMRACF